MPLDLAWIQQLEQPLELGPAAGAQQPPPAPPSSAARREAQPQYSQGSGNQHNDGLGSKMGRKWQKTPWSPM